MITYIKRYFNKINRFITKSLSKKNGDAPGPLGDLDDRCWRKQKKSYSRTIIGG